MLNFITYFIWGSSACVILMNIYGYYNFITKIASLDNFCNVKINSAINNKNKEGADKYINVLKFSNSLSKIFINGEIIFTLCFLSFVGLLSIATNEAKFVLFMGVFNVINSILLLVGCNIEKRGLDYLPVVEVINELDKQELAYDKNYKPNNIIPYINESLRKVMCWYAFLSVSSAVMSILALANITLSH